MSRNTNNIREASIPFWLLAGFLTLVFLTGGASRVDVLSLAILRPASLLFCAAALLTLKRDHLRSHFWLIGGFVGVFVLLALHLVLLPPSVWQSLPGRQLVIEVEQIAGLHNIWRPLTMTPMNGWHALLSLFVPLAVLLLGIQLNRNDLFRLLPLLLILGCLSGMLGLLQVIGDPNGPTYLYRITNNGSAVGLFANRNHAALLLACLFPMLASFASVAEGTADQQRVRQWLAIAIGVVLVPLIPVTGSRSGILIAAIGLAASAVLYRRPVTGRVVRRGEPSNLEKIIPVLGGVGVLALVTITLFFSRASAIDRLFQDSATEDNRREIWSIGMDMVWAYFPFGSGSGSFVEAYQIFEPSHMLDETYLNRAHNDWLETVITLGLPGLILLMLATAAYIKRAYASWKSEEPERRYIKYARMASVTIAMLALGSVSDYPLRTPILASVMVVMILWLNQARSDDQRRGQFVAHSPRTGD